MFNMPNINLQASNTVTLANAAALGSTVIRQLMGNELSSEINGEALSFDMVSQILVQKLGGLIIKNMTPASAPLK